MYDNIDGIKTEAEVVMDNAEYDARVMLWSAADYIYRNQLGSPARVRAMDILDAIRRDYANWHDLSAANGVRYRAYPVIPPVVLPGRASDYRRPGV